MGKWTSEVAYRLSRALKLHRIRALLIAGGQFLLLILLCHCAWASVAQEQARRAELNDRIQYLEDPTGSLHLQELLLESEPWRQNSGGVFNKGFSDSVWWLKLDIPDSTSSSQHLLEIAYPILDEVGVFIVQDGLLTQSYQTGDTRPFSSRPINSRNFVFPVYPQPRVKLTVLIRIQTASSVQAPLILWERDAFFRHEANSNFLYGLYFGGTLTLVIYNLLIFLSLRERSYLYYVGFVASSPLFFLALSGLGFRYLWPNQTDWNAHAVPIFLSFLVIFGALFTRRFLELQRFSMVMDRVIFSFAVIGVVGFLIALYMPYRTSIRLLAIVVIFACLADMVAGVLAWRKQIASARFYVMAWSVFLLGSVIFSFNKMNLLPSNIFTENAVQVGSILEAILLSFALADRINFERRLRFKAQEESLLAQVRANETLELKVSERTQELAELNQKLKELSYTDPLTHLYNRRYLEEAAAKEWQRCLRKNAHFSVLLLDIDHFKQINDRFGHDAGDYCLQTMAQHLRELLRWSTDIVSRYGGEEFCVVLPETDSAGAWEVAQRILTAVARIPLRVDSDEISITVSIGISTAKGKQDGYLSALFTEADAALYAAKSSGRNCAVLSSSLGGAKGM